MFPSAAPRGNIEILGKQNELFPSGPVIKCLLGSKHGNLIQVCNLYIILTLSLTLSDSYYYSRGGGGGGLDPCLGIGVPLGV